MVNGLDLLSTWLPWAARWAALSSLFLGQFLFFSGDYLSHKCCGDHISLPFPSPLATLSTTPSRGETTWEARMRVREFVCVCLDGGGFQPHPSSVCWAIRRFLLPACFLPKSSFACAYHLPPTKILVCSPYTTPARTPPSRDQGLALGGAELGGPEHSQTHLVGDLPPTP